MNSDTLSGSWKQFKGNLRTKWGELTDDEIEMAKGNRDVLEGTIQKKYGKTREEVAKAIDQLCHKHNYYFSAPNQPNQEEKKQAS